MAMDTKNWVVVPGESKVSFGSIKKNVVGEVHHFSGISGTVSKDGMVNIEIATKSLETNIDIRNERMLKWVFDAAFPAVKLTSKLNMKELNALKTGQMTTTDLEGVVSINGKNVDIETELFVARISEDRVLAMTDSMIMVSTNDFGIDEGVTKLMQVAKLPDITRAVPVTLRIVFKSARPQASKNSNENKIGLIQKTALTVDIKKGKKVFKKYSACHNVKKKRIKLDPIWLKLLVENLHLLKAIHTQKL